MQRTRDAYAQIKRDQAATGKKMKEIKGIRLNFNDDDDTPQQNKDDSDKDDDDSDCALSPLGQQYADALVAADATTAEQVARTMTPEQRQHFGISLSGIISSSVQ